MILTKIYQSLHRQLLQKYSVIYDLHELQKASQFQKYFTLLKEFQKSFFSTIFQSILFNRPFIFNMSLRAEDQLQTIQQLNAHTQSVPKACTVGVIIDATNAYFDQTKQKYVKKIKLVDDTYNTNKYSPFQKFPYLTVFLYSVRIEDLPNPHFIGDLLYLRRFSFGHYNESFQGHYLQAKYCSWALINTDTNSPHTEQYQTSRSDIDLGEEKYGNLSSRIRELRKFAREYISTTSILSILPTGIVPKDTDLIVQILKRTEDGFKLTNGREEIFLANIPSFASDGSIAKLRSVARLDQQGKTKVVVPNNFTSLINLSPWSHDSQAFSKHFSALEVEEDESIFTSLSQLNSMPLNECQNKKYFVKVEVAATSTAQFVQALKFYDEKKNALSDSQKGGASPVYKFNFVCIDQSLAKQNKFVEIFVFSYDGKGGDFVRRVNLQDLNEFSNYAQESLYFSQRIEQLLNAETVRMTVEVLSDGKGNRMLRALSVV